MDKYKPGSVWNWKDSIIIQILEPLDQVAEVKVLYCVDYLPYKTGEIIRIGYETLSYFRFVPEAEVAIYW